MSQDIKIDREFAALCPPLEKHERDQLEANIVEHKGCRDPLSLWNGILIDGHNRYEICTRLKLPYKVVSIDLRDRLAATAWIITNQFGRRNLSPFVRATLALKLEETLAAQCKRGRPSKASMQQNKVENSPPLLSKSKRAKTRDQVATMADLSSHTIERVKRIAEAVADGKVSAEVVRALQTGETTINAVVSDLKREDRQQALRDREASLRRKAKTNRSDLIDYRCQDVLDVIASLEDGSVDLLLTDPPYAVTDNDWDTFQSKDHYLRFMRDWLAALRPKMCEEYHAFIFCDADYSVDIALALRDTQWDVLRQAIWHRPNLAKKRSGSMTFLSSYEPFWHCGTKALHLPAEWSSERFDVQTFPVPQSTHKEDQSLHPTQKPLALFRRLVQIGSLTDALVFDPFVGSGTTAVACVHEMRRAIVNDKSQEFLDLAKGRCKEAHDERHGSAARAQ